MCPTTEADAAKTSPVARQPGAAMDNVQLRFYVREDQKCHIAYVYEWLLLLAHRLGIPTATVTRVWAGFDRSFSPSTQHIEDMTAVRMVIVEMLASEKQAQQVLDLIASENLGLTYTRHLIEYGETPRA
jgi:PII-like signaling protein